MKKKKIIFGITTTRADYGIQKSLFKKLDFNSDIDFRLLVLGTHFSKKFGYTYDEIKKDHFKSVIKFPAKFTSDNPIDLTKQLAKSYQKISQLYNEIRPSALIVLGDRFELIPIVSIANLYKIKVIHIHGGEITDGSMDNATRNAISQLSQYHLVSNDKSKNLLIKYGKKSRDVLNIGSLAIHQILKTQFLTKDYFKKKKIFFNKKIFLVIYHPNTISHYNDIEVDIFFKSLLTHKDLFYIFLMPNVDPGSSKIQEEIKKFINRNKNSIFFKSLSPIEYYSLAKLSDCIIGNSSSGIIEVPSLNTLTINVGDRQKGRLKAKSVLNAKLDLNEINKKINLVKKFEFKKIIFKNPYFKKNSLNMAINFILKRI